MHGAKGQGRPKAFGHNLLLTVACPDDDMPYAYRSSMQPFGSGSGHLGRGPPSNRDSWQSRARPRVVDEESLFSMNLPPQQPIKRVPKISANSTSPGRRNLLYRCFQVLSLLIIGVSLYALVENIKYLIHTYASEHDFSLEEVNKPNFNIHEELQSWVIHDQPEVFKQSYSTDSLSNERLSKEFLISSASSTTTSTAKSTGPSVNPKSTNYILDIKSLSFDLNNSSMCLTSNSTAKSLGEGIYFIIIVHSAPEHFEARQAIRSTWGSVKSLKNFAIRLIFILGKSGEWVEDSDLVESSVVRESEIFGDIVSGQFTDSYRNLTYKHLLGYKWAMEYCPGTAFVLKTDDDAFIDMFQLFDFITRTYGFKPSQGTLVCNVFPEGTKPVRSSDTKGIKWSVTPEEYPHSIYPKYCGGLAYLATPDVIKRILTVSDKVRFFWIDDVFVTGVLRELASVEPFYLNLRYSYEPERYRKWLNTNKSSSRQQRFPFMIAHVERGPKFSEEMNHLWRKTLRIWSEDQK